MEQARFAVHQISTDALPVLLQWISAPDVPVKQNVETWVNRHPRVPFYCESAAEKNMLAITAFSILGKSQAGAAVPALVEIVKAGRVTRTPGSRNVTFAMLAPAELDREAAAGAGIRFGTNGDGIGRSPPATENKRQ